MSYFRICESRGEKGAGFTKRAEKNYGGWYYFLE
jgi:hypothetical protein